MKTSSYFTVKVKKALGKFFDKSSMNRLAKTSGFALRRARKITPFHFVVGFLLQCSKGVSTYSEWARWIGLLSGKTVSKQALWERLHEGTVAFVRSLLEHVLLQRASHAVKAALFQPFKGVVLQDSTTLHLPRCLNQLFPGSVVRGVKTAIARIQCVLDIKRMRFVSLSLGAYTQNDQSASPSILGVVKKGDLLIRDLGYFVLRVLEQLNEQQVYILSRLRYGVKLSDYWGREIKVDALLRKGKKVDRWVYMGARQPVWVRLVMLPLPKEQAAERVRKAKADPDKRFNHAPQYYRWLRYRVFITTVGQDLWSATDVGRAYGVRWQIEIVFKSWKSGFRLQGLLEENGAEEYRVKTSIYLLLLFICLFMQNVYSRYRRGVEQQSGKLISLVKLAALFFPNMLEWLLLRPQKRKEQITLYACYEKRKDRVNMTELIYAF